jgi:DNA polymerase
MEAKLAGQTDISGFRTEVRQLLAHQVPPDQVHWRTEPHAALVYTAGGEGDSRPRGVARAATALVPASFMRLCELVVMHRDPARFDLLYRLLWRLVHEPTLRTDPTDADMLQAQHMAHAVRREVHKLKTTLRFRALPAEGPAAAMDLAWCEPSHHVIECVAPHFARRMPQQRWAILSPECSADHDSGALLYGPGVPRGEAPGYDAPDADWRACWRGVFGTREPARTTA